MSDQTSTDEKPPVTLEEYGVADRVEPSEQELVERSVLDGTLRGVVWELAENCRESMLNLPQRSTEESAGYDLFAYLHQRRVRFVEQPQGVFGQPERMRPKPSEQDADCEDVIDSREERAKYVDDEGWLYFVTLNPGDRAIIPLGFKARLPEGHYLAVVPRSGQSFKTGIRVANAPGTIDADYAEEWGVVLHNPTEYPITVHHGERIAQGIIQEYRAYPWAKGTVKQSTDRAGGFGSTGR